MTSRVLIQEALPTETGSGTERFDRAMALAAGIALRYGVVALLLLYGTFKFTAVEAEAIQPLVQHSPLMSWLYSLLSVRGVSNLIGVPEVAFAVAMSLRYLAPRVCAIGSLGAALTFVITLSFLVSTPGIWVQVPGFFLPVPNEIGGFIAKDLLLLGAALWSYAEARTAEP